jgi:hypothetical protein
MNNLKKKEDHIIELFILLINEYFDSIKEYINLDKVDNNTLFIKTGLRVIRNIFEYTLIKTKNSRCLKLYTQRSIYYYLEYIKQLQDNDIYFDTNYNKAALFVLNKIMDEVNNKDNNTLSNILSLDNNEDIIDIDIEHMSKETSIFIDNLFNWNNTSTINDYINIGKNNLSILRKNYKNIKIINNYITLLKEKIEINKEDNSNLILNACKLISNNKKKHNEYNNIIKKFYIDNDVLKDKYKNLNINEFTNWLVCYNI